jgi:hypothetical protein
MLAIKKALEILEIIETASPDRAVQLPWISQIRKRIEGSCTARPQVQLAAVQFINTRILEDKPG